MEKYKKLYDKNGRAITPNCKIYYGTEISGREYKVVLNNENPLKLNKLTAIACGSIIESDIERYMPSEFITVIG